ncbi:capsule biosynthesis protein [Chachezhania sediminis]|uniref:capsule biosynthesis protein n=1 Tax=Chachezhania sediminis TaxID=2599291 RepID=UPI00131E22F6|nr:capsule biosynthesis protein [Chachezhania sediminis]
MTTKPKARKFRIRRATTPGTAWDPETSETEVAIEAQRAALSTAGGTGATKAEDGKSGHTTGQKTGQPTGQASGQPPEQPNGPAGKGPAAAPPDDNEDDDDFSLDDDDLEDDRPAAADAARKPAARPAPGSPEAALEAIRQEGLTSRQLRMARRVALRHNLAPTSDLDAVRMLREKGIDPFQHSNMLDLVVHRKSEADRKVQLPQKVTESPDQLPSTQLSPAARREREIGEIQRDIVRRRRRSLGLLAARLAFFVGVPTLICGYYFYNIASPMYSTKSEFMILQADGAGTGQMTGLLAGTQFATTQDSIAVQSFLQSKDAMMRLDSDAGFKQHFQQPWIDPIQRLPEDATLEETYAVYNRDVKIGYDPSEGVLRMEVTAADPQSATVFSQRLIAYAEERVNDMSREKRGDQMKDAKQGLEVAQEERRQAQEALVRLQQQNALLDPEGKIASLRTMISSFETQLEEKELELSALEDNSRPNQARIDGARGDIRRLRAKIVELNDRMTQASQGEDSLASLTVKINMAQADLATRDMMMQSALQQVEQTRMEANRQVRYLTTSVKPVPSQEPSYPRKFENTLLAFLIFGGIYLMISLTASILREQVTT